MIFGQKLRKLRERKGLTQHCTHYVSRDVEHHRKLYAKGYENLRLHKPRINQEMVKRIARENRNSNGAS